MADAPALTLDDCRQLIAAGRVADSLVGIEELLTAAPGSAALLHLKGVALHLLGRSADAVACFDQAVEREPGQASIHQNRSIALLAIGRTEDAVAAAAEAVRLRPENPQAHVNLVIAESQAGRYAEAWETASRGLDLAPRHSGLLGQTTQLAILAGNTALAETYLERASAVAPDHPDIIYAAGALHQARQAHEDALRAFDRTLALQPGHQGAFLDRGIALRSLGRVKEARAHMQRGLASAPGWAALRYQLALTELLSGEWTAAWPDFELRLTRIDAPQRPATPLWDGGDVSRATLLVLHEGSLAQTIQFLRFLPFAAGRAGRVLFQCPARLHPLLLRLDLFATGTILLAADNTPLPAHDAHVPLCSLAGLAGIMPDTIPDLKVELSLEEPRLVRWSALGGREHPWRVGLGLFDSREPAADPKRAMPSDHLDELGPLLRRATFVALQRPPGQEPQIPEGLAVTIPPADFEMDRDAVLDLSALILSLDLVITTDTMVAHLAGLLGRPVWLMLETVPDWHWGLTGELTGWYPTMRLFRAPARDGWAGLMSRVAVELQHLMDASADSDDAAPGIAGTVGADIAAYALPMAAHAAAMMPANADFWSHLAALYGKLGNAADSQRALRFALDAVPDHIPSLIALAKAQSAAGRSNEALAVLDQALRCDPESVPAHAERASVLMGARRLREADAALRRALDIEPHNAALWSQLGAVQSAGRRLKNASDSWERALAIDPENADAYSGLCASERAIGDMGIACWFGRRAVECDPRHVTAWCNLGRAEFDAGRASEAAVAFRAALDLDRQNAAAHVGLGLALLSQGDLANGLRHYEARLMTGTLNAVVKRPALPLWSGGDPRGLSIMLMAEDDAGDTLMFARYALWLKERGAARVFVACHRDLVHLLATVPGLDSVVPYDEPWPAADVMAHMASMPLLTGMATGTIPAYERYLEADPERVARWEAWLGEGSGFRVGMALAGGGTGGMGKGPSFDPVLLQPLAEVPGVRLIALDRTDASAQPSGHGRGPDLERPGTEFERGPDLLADTAALIATLDLVVTSNVTVAHLAGALGKPCWVIVDSQPDWRWLAERSDSPWYPATRLFRRVRDEVEALPFAGVLSRVAEALARLVAGDRTQLAVSAMPQGVATKPFDPLATYNAALAAYLSGADATATKLFGAVLRDRELIPLALNMLGALALQATRNHRALVFLAGAERVGLQTPDMLTNFAIGLRRVGAIEAAIGRLDGIIAQAPTAEAHLTLANIYRDRCDFAPSLANYEAALALRPDFAKAHRGIGNLMRDMHRPQEALAAFERARVLAPNDADLVLDHAHAKLFAGDLVGGFRDYEYRWQSRETGASRTLTEPRWNGETAAGRVLLIHGEQGFGDNIQFARFIDEAARRVGRVVVEVRSPLVELMRRLETEKPITVVESGKPTGKVDLQIPMLSLPMAFGTTLDTIPPPARFHLDPDRVAVWRERFRGEGTTIGLVWQGNPKARADVGRSPSFAALAPLLTLPQTRFVALQKTDGLDPLRRSAHADRILVPGDALGDFAETAHAIAALDAVVSSCTATLHLAASLGVPVYGMLKFNADWRWLNAVDTSPWYPALRLFRQERPHDWEPVIARIRAVLAERMVSG